MRVSRKLALVAGMRKLLVIRRHAQAAAHGATSLRYFSLLQTVS